MAAIDLARDYIWKVNARDGAAAAALFAPDGEIVDPRGGTHHGHEAIAAFVNAATLGTLAQIGERHMGTGHALLRGVVITAGLPPAEVEWQFETAGDQITRLTIRLPKPDEG
ncbi:MAG TPA: nuclear transport factor 2 family protein [Nitrolancea sp.]|nr:nuclear transport factor 2 family protein [Nitrolancea sp.]